MSQKYPITISSWTLGDQCTFEERVSAAKEAGFEGIGLRAETYVDALNEGLFDADILAILDKYDLPTQTDHPLEALYRAALSDKKISGGKMHLIVPEAIGRCRIESIPEAEIRDWMRDGGIQ